jgi:hypothetical protein
MFSSHNPPLFLHRSSLIRIIVRRSGRQPTEHHGNNTERTGARLAFDKYQCGGRVLKEQQSTGSLFGYLPLGGFSLA